MSELAAVPTEWENRIANLLERFPAATRDDVVEALRRHDGHAGKCQGDLPLTEAQESECAANGFFSPAHVSPQIVSCRNVKNTTPLTHVAGVEWAARARAGGRCFTDGGTMTQWGAECVVDAMRSLGKTIRFASQWDGRTVYSWERGHVLREHESVHGGPRLGEPGCDRELLSADAFCARIAGDGCQHQNTFAARTRPWFAEHELQ